MRQEKRRERGKGEEETRLANREEAETKERGKRERVSREEERTKQKADMSSNMNRHSA